MGTAAAAANDEAVHLSAFERFKAQRRNSRRYGHKLYKKKYKDYLRYATKSIPATATTTASTSISVAAAAAATGNDDVAMSAESTVNIKTPTTKLTNGSDDKPEHSQLGADAAQARAHKRAEKLRKYARKIEAEKSRGLPASPIFVVGNRNTADGDGNTATNKPFYEGQINYYLETKDDNAYEMVSNMATMPPLLPYDDVDLDGRHDDADTNLLLSRDERLRQHGRNMERVIAADNNNWYQRVSPVLRNGIKVLNSDGKPPQLAQMAQQESTRHNQQHQAHHQRNAHQHQHQHQHHHQHQRQHHHQHGHQHQHHSLHHQRSSGSGSGNHHKHHQHGKHYQSGAAQMNPYQRKLLPTVSKGPLSPHAPAPQPVETVAATVAQTPIPPPAYRPQRGNALQQLGHQITEMEEFERYYAKWPHLARVQFQVYDEHYREAHPELYPDTSADNNNADYDDDYESAAELEEAQSGHDEDANLPPYIKKYNRRNKQLLNLLEGTLPPPTRPPPIVHTWSSSLLQPGPHDSSRVRLDDDYQKEKRKRYHIRDNGQSNNDDKNARHRYADLFAQQRDESTSDVATAASWTIVNGSKAIAIAGLGTTPTPPKLAALHSTAEKSTATPGPRVENQLPDEDVSMSRPEGDVNADADGDGDTEADDIWPKEMENKSNANEMTGSAQMTWQIEKLTSPTTAAAAADGASTPKAAIYRLPSYPAIAGSFIGKPRSRSAQFAPSGGSRGSLAYVQSASAGGSRLSNIYGNNVGGGGSNSKSNYHKSLSRFSAYKPNAYKSLSASAAAAAAAKVASASVSSTATPASHDAEVTPAAAGELGSGGGGGGRTISSFVYHRVVDASPRLVGTGATGRKQRLPFVAITDRRLETSKKTLLERQKDFEQNHYPMP